MAISQFPSTSGGADPIGYNRAYVTELSGSVPVDIEPGVYSVTVSSSGNIVMGTNTIINNSTGTYFIRTQQNYMTIAPLGASGAVPWGLIGNYSYENSAGYTTRPVAFGNDLYLIGIHNHEGNTFTPQLRVSTTGVGNWSHPLNITPNGQFQAGSYGHGRYVFPVAYGSAGGQLWSSTNAFHWENPINGTNFFFARFLNNIFLVGGDGANLRTSTNGVVWSASNTAAQSAFQNRSMRAIAFGNGTYVISGTEGQLITSTDLVTWTTRNSNAVGAALVAAAFGNGTFVVAGSGQLRTSTNGEVWSIRIFGNQEPIYEIIFQGGIFIAAARYSVQTSVDGNTWTLRTNPPLYGNSGTNYHAFGLFFGKGRYLMGGFEYSPNSGRQHAFLVTTTTFGGSATAETQILFEKKAEISDIV